MKSLNHIADDGFSLSTPNKQLPDLALLSLRIALRAYFSTYKAMRGSLWALRPSMHGMTQEQRQLTSDYHHDPAYCEAYSQTIVHFHHFAELCVKELLRREHPLLAVDVSRRPRILHALLMKQDIDPLEETELRSVEFSEALDRLCDLIRSREIRSHRKLHFVLKARPFLDKLNWLRNRILHRGTYVLRYSALDAFVGQYTLPFVDRALRLPIYSNSKFQWRYPKLDCRTDPIRKLVAEARQTAPSTQRIALLKELGRAAYANPLPRGPFRKQTRGIALQETAEVEAQRLAMSEAKEAGAVEVRVCPVCGVEALLVYGDIQSQEFYDSRTGTVVDLGEEFYTYEVRCLCCTFQIEDELQEGAFKGLPINSYWFTQKLSDE
jgi:hypothetical protein